MKIILLSLMLLLSGIAGAQIVNIPDAEFKAYLLSASSSNDIAKNANGDSVSIDMNSDNEIQVTEALLITELIVDSTASSLEGIEAFTNLISVTVKGCPNLQEADFSQLLSLQEIVVTLSNALTILNVSNLENLLELVVEDNNNLDSIVIGNLPQLNSLNLRGHLDDLELPPLPNLIELNLEAYSMQNIDVSGSPNLDQLDIFVESARYINVKNGKNTYSQFVFDYSLAIADMYICTDEGEQLYFAEAIDEDDYEQIFLNSYCSYVPGGDYNTISGTITVDGDNDGCGMGNDSQSRLVRVVIEDGSETGATFTNISGEYTFFAQEGNFTIHPDVDYFTVIPATVNFPAVDNATEYRHFCLTPDGVHPDLAVAFIPLEISGPGFDALYKMVYLNKGNQTLTGSVTLTYDDTTLDYVSSDPAESVTAPGSIMWNFSDLAPFQNGSSVVTFNLNSPQETPALNIDDHLVYTISIDPVTGDETPLDNTFILDQTVIGSYDPNDKMCLEGDTVSPDMIGEYLQYNINFENTGTAPATFIVVKDVINPAQFDISTLQVLNASHDMTVKVEGNTVEFRFDDIDLGPLEKGNVLFKVKTLGTLQVNDEVSNYADIFFDYNFPITTNEATSTFQVLGTDGFTRDHSVKVYPNPSKGIVAVSADSTLTSVALYDLQGRLLYTTLPNHTETILNIADRAAGVYFVKVTSEKGSKVEKIIKE